MKFYPGECKPGDVIRVRLGTVCHFGIFVSEQEVIQFGLPPLPEYRRPEPEIAVLATDIDLFSCGKTVEIYKPERGDRGRHYSRKQVVARARARLGETGYNLLHNNCEHFAFFCARGVHYCSFEDNARQRWLKRPLLDVYIARPGELPGDYELPRSVLKRLSKAETPDTLRAQWQLLAAAAARTYGCALTELRFRKAKDGRLVTDRFCFDFAEKDGCVLAAVSGKPVTLTVSGPADVTACLNGVTVGVSGENTGALRRYAVEGRNPKLLPAKLSGEAAE